MAGNFQNIGSFLVPAASGQLIIDVDRNDIKNLMMLFQQNYTAVGTPTGLALIVYDGYGIGDPTSTGGVPIKVGGTSKATFATNGTPYSLSVPTSGQKTTGDSFAFKTSSGPFAFNQVPRWIRLQFTNNDSTNVCTLVILGDI